MNEEFNFFDSDLDNNSVSGLQPYANRLSYQIAIATSQEEKNKQLISDCDLRVLEGDAKGQNSYRSDGNPIYIQFRKEDISAQRAEQRLCSFRRFRNEIELQEDVLRHRPKRYLGAQEY